MIARSDADAAADDFVLAAAAGRGDAAAFRSLVGRHTDRAFAVACRVTGNAAEAEDVVQEAFLRAWSALPRWRQGDAAFGTWLHRVVLNLSLDVLRRRRRRGEGPLPAEDADEPAADRPDGETACLEAAARRRLLAEVRALPERQRVAIILSYAGAFTDRESADIMGVSVRALESLLGRARRGPRERLGEDRR